MTQSIYQLLRTNHIFQDVDRYSFSLIEDYFFFRQMSVGDYLFHEGDHGDFVAFVVAGCLSILKTNENGEEIELTLKQVGDSAGDMSIIDELSRSATAKAVKKTGLVILPKADFGRILEDYPKIGIKMLKGMSTMLSLNLRKTSEDLSKVKRELEHIKAVAD